MNNIMKKKYPIDVPALLTKIDASGLFNKYWKKNHLENVNDIPILTSMEEVREFYEKLPPMLNVYGDDQILAFRAIILGVGSTMHQATAQRTQLHLRIALTELLKLGMLHAGHQQGQRIGFAHGRDRQFGQARAQGARDPSQRPWVVVVLDQQFDQWGQVPALLVLGLKGDGAVKQGQQGAEL